MAVFFGTLIILMSTHFAPNALANSSAIMKNPLTPKYFQTTSGKDLEPSDTTAAEGEDEMEEERIIFIITSVIGLLLIASLVGIITNRLRLPNRRIRTNWFDIIFTWSRKHRNFTSGFSRFTRTTVNFRGSFSHQGK